MQIALDIQPEQITNLLTTAIESGDPVTTASRGGWCNGIYWNTKSERPPAALWYANLANFAGPFKLEVHEVADEDNFDPDATDKQNLKTGALVIHSVDQEKVRKGLGVMMQDFPDYFAQIMKDNIDAPCADIFLQCVLFGEEKYA